MIARLSAPRSPSRPGGRRQRGFTLLETVVTLVVVSMLVAMLMQALNQAPPEVFDRALLAELRRRNAM